VGLTASADAIRLLGSELRRMDVTDYHRMIKAGIFDEDERVELLEGVIVTMSPQNPDHALVVERLTNPRFLRSPADFVIRCQLPLLLSDTDEPEPDVAIIHCDTPRSRQQHPTTARIVFEVASGSLRIDREVKAALYARAAIPEYVIVNLKDDSLEVHRDPDPAQGAYRVVTTLGKADAFTSASVQGLGFAVADLLA
jgi:Uma2 family endonuclease